MVSVNAIYYLMTRSNFPVPVSLILREVINHGGFITTSPELNNDAAAQGFRSLVGIIGSVPPVIVGWILIWFNKYFFRVEKSQTSDDNLSGINGENRK